MLFRCGIPSFSPSQLSLPELTGLGLEVGEVEKTEGAGCGFTYV